MPYPFPVLQIIGYPDTFLVLWLAASPYTLWFSVQRAITPILAAQYRLNPFQVSLCFLAGGIGIIAGGSLAGKLMDRNYTHVALRVGLSIDKRKGDDNGHFPNRTRPLALDDPHRAGFPVLRCGTRPGGRFRSSPRCPARPTVLRGTALHGPTPDV